MAVTTGGDRSAAMGVSGARALGAQASGDQRYEQQRGCRALGPWALGGPRAASVGLLPSGRRVGGVGGSRKKWKKRVGQGVCSGGGYGRGRGFWELAFRWIENYERVFMVFLKKLLKENIK